MKCNLLKDSDHLAHRQFTLSCLNVSQVVLVCPDHEQCSTPSSQFLFSSNASFTARSSLSPMSCCALLGWVSLSRRHTGGGSYLDQSAVRARLQLRCPGRRRPRQKAATGQDGSRLGRRWKVLSAGRMLLQFPQTTGTGLRWR